MRCKPLLIAFAALFTFALLWNGFFHLILLAKVNASVQHLHRPDLADKMWLSLLLTAGVVALFIFGYRSFARSYSVREGAGYGLFFAALAGLLVDLNQYVLYPVPASTAALWFLGGVVEFTLYGMIASRLPLRADLLERHTGEQA